MPDPNMTRRTALTASVIGAATAVASRSAFAQEPEGAKHYDELKNSPLSLGSSEFPSIKQLDPKAKSLGSEVSLWHGDDLPRRVGGPPRGYVTKTYMTQWTRGADSVGYMSFGPYFRPSGTGSLFKIRIIMSLNNRGAATDDVLTVDVVDNADGGRNLITPVTFKVRNFPTESEGFIIFSTTEIAIKPSMKIESRVFAHGGASLSLYQIRFDAHYL